VHHQRATLAKLAPCAAVGGEVWTKLRRSDPADAVVVRVSRRPSELARLWLAAMTVPGVDAHATLARGIVRLRLTSESFPANALDGGDRVIYESAPPGRRAGATGEVHDVLSRRLRDAFDPRRILNRGILGPDPTT
jgi:hypothetical protein